jgi:hypothetical protein
MGLLPTQDYPECKATLWAVREALNARLAQHWGDALVLQGMPSEPGSLKEATGRLRRGMELIHELPIEDFAETRALLDTVERVLDNEVKMIWEAATRQRSRLPRTPGFAGMGGVLPFRRAREGEPVTEVA